MPKLTIETWEVNYINKMARATAKAEGRSYPKRFTIKDLRVMEKGFRLLLNTKALTAIEQARCAYLNNPLAKGGK